jgi:ABC-type nitrate/sulfonate/bicarbonate transport system ATPase subunit
VIEIVDLRKTHWARATGEAVEALRDVNLTIGENEFVTILGPSGCGKTTLLRCIGGLTGYDAGQVLIDGRRVQGPGPDRAMVFQSFALMPWATVFDNVTFALEVRGTPKDERKQRAEEFIAKVGLSGFESKYPRQLSGGMQQRVGLARALAVQPSILLMDEPFSALDEQTRRFMQEELLRIWELDRTTVVFVTHSIEEAVLLGDRVILLGPRPGTVREVVSVPLERPRSKHISSVEASASFARLTAKLWDELRGMRQSDIPEAFEAS